MLIAPFLCRPDSVPLTSGGYYVPPTSGGSSTVVTHPKIDFSAKRITSCGLITKPQNFKIPQSYWDTISTT
jgi:hypothetical protein